MRHPARLQSFLLRSTALALALTTLGGTAFANPEGGVVAAGAADIVGGVGRLDVHQYTDRAVIDWRSFDIGADEITQFHQPDASSVALNRVNSIDPSVILGKLSANGNVVLINPNGVFFGAGSKVDVNGLIATSADIGNASFMAGGAMKFDKPGNAGAVIVNEGEITANDAGLVGLVAPNVLNNGIIRAKIGRVELASADTFTVDMYGNGLTEIAVSGAVKSQILANTGRIEAAGGTIAMTAAAGKDIVNSLVHVGGELQAPAVSQSGGKIRIYAEGSNAVQNNVAADKNTKQGSSTVTVSAFLDVSGRGTGKHGGSIEILGDNVGILNGTVIDASGDTGGGDIKIGGDYLGTGTTSTARNMFVDTYTLIYNDALTKGDGGRTIVWSDGDTAFKGNIYARGGALSGNGGFVETSGHDNLLAQGFVDLTAANGEKGLYFLDPTNITIYGNVDPAFTSTDGTINLNSNLQVWLDASDLSKISVTYSTDGLSAATASGTVGTKTITTSADVSASLAVGARIRLTGAGAVTTASTIGNDTYTIAAISGTTITTVENLSTTYNAGTSLYRGLVSQWNDKGGVAQNAVQASEASMPLLVTNGRNGNAILKFDGVNDNLISAIDATKNGMPNATFFGLISSTIASQPAESAAIGIDGPGNYNRRTGVSGASFELAGTGGGFVSAGSYSAGTYYIASTTYQNLVASGSSYNVNGSLYSGNFTENQNGGATTDIMIGGLGVGRSQRFNGFIPEVIVYNTNLASDSRSFIEQYQSAKWNVTLDPYSGTALSEATEAMDTTNGYSIFTTRYLERLSQSANISLQASTDINLDLKGDNLNLASGKNFTLTAGNDIKSLSNGAITTSGAGNITLTAGRDITFAHDVDLNASGTGSVTLNATRHTSFATGSSITSAASGNAIAVAAGGNFINNAGANLLNATNGRWLVYSTAPGSNTRGGLTANESAVFSKTYATGTPGTIASGNRFVFSIDESAAPALTLTPNKITQTYGTALKPDGYNATGFLAGDDAANSLSGTPAYSTSLSLQSADGIYANALEMAAGSLKNFNGYRLTFNKGDIRMTGQPTISNVQAIVPASVQYLSQKPLAVTTVTPEQNEHQRDANLTSAETSGNITSKNISQFNMQGMIDALDRMLWIDRSLIYDIKNLPWMAYRR